MGCFHQYGDGIWAWTCSVLFRVDMYWVLYGGLSPLAWPWTTRGQGPLCLMPACLLRHLVESLSTEPVPQVRRAWSAHLQGWTSSALTASVLGLQDLHP